MATDASVSKVADKKMGNETRLLFKAFSQRNAIWQSKPDTATEINL
jgi:hypothetical protein